MSAPARAWLTAVRASSSSEASLSTVPSSRRTPQWPWEVYSQRHTSVITSSSGTRLLDRARGQLHDALLVPRAGAVRVLLGGQPEQHHRGDAERGRLLRLLDDGAQRQAIDAWHRRDRLTSRPPGWAGAVRRRRGRPR